MLAPCVFIVNISPRNHVTSSLFLNISLKGKDFVCTWTMLSHKDKIIFIITLSHLPFLLCLFALMVCKQQFKSGQWSQAYCVCLHLSNAEKKKYSFHLMPVMKQENMIDFIKSQRRLHCCYLNWYHQISNVPDCLISVLFSIFFVPFMMWSRTHSAFTWHFS